MYIVKIENNYCTLYDERGNKFRTIGNSGAIQGMCLNDKVIITYNNGNCELYNIRGHKLRDIARGDGYIRNALISGEDVISITFNNGMIWLYNFRGSKLRQI